MNGCSWQLRCYGGAGVGKTHLCALIINHLQDILPKRFPNETRSRPVIYIYLSDDEDTREKQTKDAILGSLVKQLVQIQNASAVPDKLVKAHRRELGYEPVLKSVFEDLLNYFERNYLIVDGMYQCSSDVLHLVKDYPLSLIRKGFRLSLLTTSCGYREAFKVIKCDNESCPRSKLDVHFNCSCTEEGYDLCLHCKLVDKISCPNNHIGRERYDTVRVEVHGRDDDIHNYCLQRLRVLEDTSHRESDDRIENPPLPSSQLGRHLVRKPEMVKLIANEIVYNGQRNFLIANGWLEDLKKINFNSRPTFDEAIKETLVSVPTGIFKIYVRKKFKLIKDHKSQGEFDLATKAISFVMAAYVPFTVLALQHALSLDTDDEIRENHLAERADIIRAANGLLTVDKASPAESFVSFFHPSFRRITVDSDSSFTNHHSRMAKLCLKYLDHDDFLGHSDDPESYSFLLYAMEYWGDHVRKACVNDNAEVHSSARAFLLNSNKVRQMAKKARTIARKAAELAQMDEEMAQQYPKVKFTIPPSWFNESISAFHLCAWYNLPDLIEDLHRDLPRKDILDSKGRPPLRHACFNGSSGAVGELLKSDSVSTDTPQDPSALIRQAAIRDVINGLSQSTRVDKEDRALIERRVDIINLILRHSDLTLDSSIDYQGSTPLMCVVKEGLHNFAKMLLQRESVDVNVLSNDGRSALWYAMGSTDDGSPSLLDHEQIESMTKLLLSHGATLGGVSEQPAENFPTKAISSISL
ncbi:hypothetical protein N7488_005130 [Penicillium malachiteum]|nr:hypothetical protein N7488_005130 [Penicillium malachiteum]